MTLDVTLALIRAIIADVPVAITTGTELLRLISDAVSRFEQGTQADPSPDDIRRLLAEITGNSRRIQSGN